MAGLQTNSLDKIAKTYFAGLCSKPFEYAGEVFQPKLTVISPHIFRGSTCPMGCGGCCFKFSLVWMPHEPHPDGPTEESRISISGVERVVLVDRQPSNTGHFCQHLIQPTGRCGIHRRHPFTCDFETIRFVHRADRCDIGVRLFGRGWSYTRVTGQVGAQCDLLPPSDHNRDESVRKLTRLKAWADYFEVPTHLDRIIQWVASGPHDVPLYIAPGRRTLLDIVNQ